MRSTQVSLEADVADAAAALDAAVARIADLAVAGAFDAVLPAMQPAVATTLLRAADRAQAAAVMAASAVDRSGRLPDGHVSLARWLQAALGLSRRDAGALLARAADVRGDYAATGAAWLDGQVSGSQVRTITTALDRALRVLPADTRQAVRAEQERDLLASAEHLDADDLGRVITHLRIHVDPDGATQAQLDAYDEQHLAFTPVGAGVDVRGWLSHETAALVMTALDQVVDGLHRSGALAAEDRVEGEDARADRLRRLREGHLRAVALGQVCADALESGALGTHHAAVPRVTLVVDLDHLAHGLGGELLLPGRAVPEVLPPASIRRILCDAEITHTVERKCSSGTGADGLASLLRQASREVLWVGRAQRTVPVRLRRALERRDHHCAFPGCRVNVARCRAHHVTPWELDGPTDLDNCVLVCERHHHAVHEGGWTITPTGPDPRRTGYWTFHPPPRHQP